MLIERKFAARRRIAVSTALAAAGTALALPFAVSAQAAAAPATAGIQNNVLTYDAADGQANDLTVSVKIGATDPDSTLPYYVFTLDDTVPIAPGAGCALPDSTDDTKVECDILAPADEASYLTSLIVNLGDGDDSATVTDNSIAYTVINGGTGNDTITGHGRDVLYGNSGDDHVYGGGGVYAEGSFGGPGNDVLGECAYTCHGGPGADVIAGTDTGQRTDGLYGDGGDDTIYGNAGADHIYGGEDNDTLYGGTGDDFIYGNSGDDVIYGNSGNDSISGGPGMDWISGGTGDTTILS
ncbi:Hemolysin-type calcium-binding region protein [Actinobacteria bacterium OK074]|nr:Hemolysin-type calcium-binding region protein [Actinobacteria bacterium OK074]